MTMAITNTGRPSPTKRVDNVDMKQLIAATLAAGAIITAAPSRAFADATLFWGASPTPATRPVKGFAVGLSLIVIGFEFEYANTTEKLLDGAPGVRTGMINGSIQTPTHTQFYLTAGGGFFRERLGTESETSFGTNIGGGIKLGLAGPLRLRLDYRVFNLRGSARYPHPQRFYAGVNLAF
jgi:hypothetical protein